MRGWQVVLLLLYWVLALAAVVTWSQGTRLQQLARLTQAKPANYYDVGNRSLATDVVGLMLLYVQLSIGAVLATWTHLPYKLGWLVLEVANLVAVVTLSALNQDTLSAGSYSGAPPPIALAGDNNTWLTFGAYFPAVFAGSAAVLALVYLTINQFSRIELSAEPLGGTAALWGARLVAALLATTGLALMVTGSWAYSLSQGAAPGTLTSDANAQQARIKVARSTFTSLSVGLTCMMLVCSWRSRAWLAAWLGVLAATIIGACVDEAVFHNQTPDNVPVSPLPGDLTRWRQFDDIWPALLGALILALAVAALVATAVPAWRRWVTFVH